MISVACINVNVLVVNLYYNLARYYYCRKLGKSTQDSSFKKYGSVLISGSGHKEFEGLISIFTRR